MADNKKKNRQMHECIDAKALLGIHWLLIRTITLCHANRLRDCDHIIADELKY